MLLGMEIYWSSILNGVLDTIEADEKDASEIGNAFVGPIGVLTVCFPNEEIIQAKGADPYTQ